MVELSLKSKKLFKMLRLWTIEATLLPVYWQTLNNEGATSMEEGLVVIAVSGFPVS